MKTALKKNDIITADITENITLSKSLAYYEDKKILIDGGYAGQNADIRIVKMRPKRWEAVIEKINSHAPYEITPPCPDFTRCGGCRFQDIPYTMQAEMKEQYLLSLFNKAGIEYGEFEKLLPSPVEYHYRNKMEFSFGDELKDGELTLGMHEKRKHHNILSITDCKISPEDFSVILKAVETYFRKKGETYYNQYTKTGFLRHLVLRKASDELLINLVTTKERPLDADEFVAVLLNLPLKSKIAGILHTLNNSFSDAVKPEEVRLLYGKSTITESLCGLRFEITPFSFFQTNTKGAEVLYNKVREYAGNCADKTVFDLYCGTGTIAQVMAQQAKHVYGIEIVDEAIKAAKDNAVLNRINNCTFICGDVLEKVEELKDHADVIILDPPRAGIHPKAIDKILSFAPSTFIYVSCKATSLINDLPKFIDAGYKIEKICGVDMFPHTEHVECCCLLSRANK